jgi:hypothetical protein
MVTGDVDARPDWGRADLPNQCRCAPPMRVRSVAWLNSMCRTAEFGAV